MILFKNQLANVFYNNTLQDYESFMEHKYNNVTYMFYILNCTLSSDYTNL